MIGIIETIKEVCFGIDAQERKEIHGHVLDRLKRLFVKNGYRVHLEYPICFDSIVRKSGDMISKNGYLDLVAVKEKWKIAIEFDTGVHLKFKSIEKLFQVDADICIGIIRGRSNTLGANIERIEQVRGEFGFLKKDFWLIILSDRISHKV
jgi:hypothetical protein